MKTPTTRHVAAVCGDGRIRLVEQPTPEVGPGKVLVEVHASLVSPGTELGGWPALAAKRKQPEETWKPVPFGYSNAGVVVAAGEGVTHRKVGDRVACIGAKLALHTDYCVMPQNLTFPLPPSLGFDQGAYAMLAATGLFAMRRGEPQFGEAVAIVGLGLVGQLTGSLYQLAGNFVIGWDTVGFRTDLAGRRGFDATVLVGRDAPVQRTRDFTTGLGLDAAVVAHGGNADRTMESLYRCMKKTPDGHEVGRIVVVGGATFTHPAATTNLDVRRASRTGPGYHDDAWEHGLDYPPVLVRWDTQANVNLCLRLIAEGRLDVDSLTTHRIPLEHVEAEVDRMLADPDGIQGVVLLPHSGRHA